MTFGRDGWPTGGRNEVEHGGAEPSIAQIFYLIIHKKMTKLSELIHKFESWPEPIKPPFSEIKRIGCCEVHEQEGDFVWYRKYNWQELRDLILSKDRIIEREIDPSNFKILYPNVFRYYVKGALSALAQEVESASSFGELPFVVWQWIAHDKKDEGPSIGIILCKDKSKTIVEYTLRDSNEPIGIGTYRVLKILPKELKKELPSPEQIQELVGEIE